MITDLVAQIDEKLSKAAQDLTTQAGADSLCQLAKDGRITGGLKYRERQMIALQSLKKLVGTAGQSD